MKKIILLLTTAFIALNFIGKCVYADPIDSLGSNYELILFYSSTCPHCQKFVPIFEDVVNHYHLKYTAFTMNGGTLDGLADKTLPATQKIMQNFYQGMSEQGVVPAVFIIDVNTMNYLPISIGEEPEAQLVTDINRTASALIKEEQLK